MPTENLQSPPERARGVGSSAARLPWVDNLRTLLILLVVNLHACITYSHVGGWYVKEPPEPPLVIRAAFLLWEGHLQAFFMGLLFFLAGFFAHFSLERRGAKNFVRERLLRLGIPFLGYIFVIEPFIIFILNPWGTRHPPLVEAYTHYLTSGRFMGSTGPLWFVEALLIFSVVFAAFRAMRGSTMQPSSGVTRWSTIRTSRFLLIAAFLGVTSFLVRTVQPIGVSILNLQLCFFPQYIVAFSLGILVARRFDLASLTRLPAARRFGVTAVVLGPLALAGIVAAAIPHIEQGEDARFWGGWNSFALSYAVWEQFAAVALSLGIMVFAARRLNFETPWSRWLNERSFGVYVIHAPVLVGLAMLLRGLHANPFAMAALLTVLGLVASFAVADLLKRIPVVRAAV
jgi:peptidoglycan/LPS O-acetylase OafA/YrhL